MTHRPPTTLRTTHTTLPVLLLIGAAAVAGCGEGGMRADEDAVPDIESASPDTDAPPPPPGGDMAGSGSDDGCGLHRSQAHPDPVRLVRDYATRDSAGAFLRHSEWLETAVACPNAVPGFDMATVIASFDVGRAVGSGDTVRVPVTYRQLGELVQDEFDPAPATVTDTFDVVRTPHGWRILGPELQWHLSRDRVLAGLPLAPESEEALRGADR